MGLRELIKKVQFYSGFSDAESQQALELMTENIAARLNDGERQDFASQLPAELQEIALSAKTEGKHESDLIQDFMDKEGIPADRAKKQILGVWRAFKDAISPGEIDDIRAQLPNETVAFLG